MPRYGREDERWWEERNEREGGRVPWRPQEERMASRESREPDWRDRDWRDESSREREWRAGPREREEERREVMQGGDRGWPGGVRGAEGGSPYGTGMFGTAYGLYAGRPERETYRRHDEDWRHREGQTAREGMRGYREEGRDWYPQYRGRPPRAYRRSDERILDDIVERLLVAAVDASEVEVKVENGEVTLSGTVRERRDKRRIEDACEDVFGVQDVHNQIRVVREGEGQPGDVH